MITVSVIIRYKLETWLKSTSTGTHVGTLAQKKRKNRNFKNVSVENF